MKIDTIVILFLFLLQFAPKFSGTQCLFILQIIEISWDTTGVVNVTPGGQVVHQNMTNHVKPIVNKMLGEGWRLVRVHI